MTSRRASLRQPRAVPAEVAARRRRGRSARRKRRSLYEAETFRSLVEQPTPAPASIRRSGIGNRDVTPRVNERRRVGQISAEQLVAAVAAEDDLARGAHTSRARVQTASADESASGSSACSTSCRKILQRLRVQSGLR